MPLFSDPKDRKYAMLGMRIAADFGGAIAVPVVLFVLIGQWLDARYGNGSRYTIGAFILAALISGRIVYKKAKAYGKEFQELDEKGTRNKE